MIEKISLVSFGKWPKNNPEKSIISGMVNYNDFVYGLLHIKDCQPFWDIVYFECSQLGLDPCVAPNFFE